MSPQPDASSTFLAGRVHATVGDITRQEVDAIVNAANDSLYGGGGVDGAIHAAGGPQILKECEVIRRTRYPEGLPTGEAVITSGGRLPARHVIHTVGPVKGLNGERDAELLASCYHQSLLLAVQHRVRTIAFPAISTGIYGYPMDEAAAISSQVIRDFFTASLISDSTIEEVRLVFFREAHLKIFLKHHCFDH